MKKNETIIPFEKRYPELAQAAQEIADITCFIINKRAHHIESKTEYKAQGILEHVIQLLQERV